jgi:hypothetical protein
MGASLANASHYPRVRASEACTALAIIRNRRWTYPFLRPDGSRESIALSSLLLILLLYRVFSIISDS